MTEKKSVEFIKGMSVQFPLIIALDADKHDSIMSDIPQSLGPLSLALRMYTHACIWQNSGNPAKGSSAYPASVKYAHNHFNMATDLLVFYNIFARKIHKMLKAMNSAEFDEYYKKRKNILSQYVNSSGWPNEIQFSNFPPMMSLMRPGDAPRRNIDDTYALVADIVSDALGKLPMGIGSSAAYMPVVSKGAVVLIAIFEDDPMYKLIRSISYSENNQRRNTPRTAKAEDPEKLAAELIERVKLKDFKFTDNSKLSSKGKKKKGGDA